jgi:hypothetical protein
MKRKPEDKGFAFTLDKEKIRATYNMSAKDKLEWLEEANRFVNASMTPAKRKRWAKIKNGVL